MIYEIDELLEVGDAGSTIQAEKCCFLDELSGSARQLRRSPVSQGAADCWRRV